MKLNLTWLLASVPICAAVIFLSTLGEKSAATEARKYLDSLKLINETDILRIDITNVYSDYCNQRTVDLTEQDFKIFADLMKIDSGRHVGIVRLAPTEVYEVQVTLKQNAAVCFELINSPKYGSVVRYVNDCRRKVKIIDITNEALLDFVRKKCKVVPLGT